MISVGLVVAWTLVLAALLGLGALTVLAFSWVLTFFGLFCRGTSK